MKLNSTRSLNSNPTAQSSWIRPVLFPIDRVWSNGRLWVSQYNPNSFWPPYMAHFLATGELVSLSEQQLVDCDHEVCALFPSEYCSSIFLVWLLLLVSVFHLHIVVLINGSYDIWWVQYLFRGFIEENFHTICNYHLSL